MAKPFISKSESVRTYLTEHPDASTNEVLSALAGQGINTTNALVYKVKGAMAERKHRKQRVVKAAMAAAPASNGVPIKADAITMIREVKALAAKAGGYDKLKELVDALAE